MKAPRLDDPHPNESWLNTKMTGIRRAKQLLFAETTYLPCASKFCS